MISTVPTLLLVLLGTATLWFCCLLHCLFLPNETTVQREYYNKTRLWLATAAPVPVFLLLCVLIQVGKAGLCG